MSEFKRLLVLTLFVLSASCNSMSDADRVTIDSMRGEILYSRVGMHAELQDNKQHAYSTNFYELPLYWPPNSQFRVVGTSKSDVVLLDTKTKRELFLTFVQKHNLVSLADYMKQQFAKDHPKSEKISAKDADLVKKGLFEIGMSKTAFIMAMGYPPRSLSPDINADVLHYQAKRFKGTTFIFTKGVLTKTTDN